MVMSFCAVLFPRGVLDEILNLIESVSEGFPSYSFTNPSENCAEIEIIPMYSLEKKPEVLLFPLLNYTRTKSRKGVIITISNGYKSETKEREFQVHIFNSKCIIWH